MSLKSLPECCLTLYLYYSCSTLRKATLIVISGYGVMPSVLKTSFTGETVDLPLYFQTSVIT
ncbi:hypothetical protein EYY15_18505 [Escherichia coli]|nr:hypothetical protein EYY15_18505 [Escherichia coli]